MLHTKYKYFNNKMKMFFLLFILMWSLMGQPSPYGKSSTSDVGFITAAVCTGQEDFVGYNINGRGGITTQEHIAEIITKNDAKKSVLSTSSITTATENNGKSNNAAGTTIYDHFNENDNNNSNKLPQRVARRDQKQSNMMYMNMIESATSQSTASLISAKSVGEVAALPPTESLLVPKDQFNKTQYTKTISSSENTLEEEVNFNETRACKTVQNSASNNKNVHNVSKDETTKSNLHKKSSKNKFDKVKAENKSSNMDSDKINNEISSKLTAFHTPAHAQQELILQFALKFKQIPRVTYFTCKDATKAKERSNINVQQNNNSKRHTSMNMDTVEFVTRLFRSNTSSLMMRVVLIDHLVNKNLGGMSKSVTRGGFDRTGLFGIASDATTRNTFKNISWLEQVLRPEPLRQIVVLNLSCGLSSRRLLEMASNKAFFNSMYHWLLLEDYVFNRQTVIDDSDDIESKMNSYSNSNSNSTQADKSFKKEIVNDSNATNGQVKQLSIYLKDVIGVCTSGLGPDEQNNVTATNTYKIVADYGQQQQHFLDEKLKSSSTSSTASRAGITDEDDIEIIEKFLEKLNININTELILAKRHMRALVPPNNSPACSSSQSTHIYNMMPTTPLPPTFALTNSTSMDLNDYKTLQKMDYYLLYDIWNPGLQYGGALNISKIGNFTRSAGLYLDKWYGTASTTRRRLNMQLARIRCLVVITHKNGSESLEEYLTSRHDTHLDSMNRFNFALLTHVRDLFNFRPHS